MRSTTHRLTWAGAIVMGALALMPRAYAEESDKAALAAALAKVATTLEKGLQASEKIGKPISAKFEIEDGKLQLSIYTVAPAGFTEVIVALDSGGVASSEKITDADDLKAAAAQKAAMTKAKLPLLTATETAVKANTGSRAVSVYPQLQGGNPVAEVTLLQGTTFKKVTEKLD